MVYTCIACKWRGDRKPRRSFHKFPSDEVQKQKWLDILGKSNIAVGTRTPVCSLHFEKNCFRYGLVNGRQLLKEGSVPSLYLTKEAADSFLQERIESTNKNSSGGEQVIESSEKIFENGIPDKQVSWNNKTSEHCIIESDPWIHINVDEIPARTNEVIRNEVSNQNTGLNKSALSNSIEYRSNESNPWRYLKNQLVEKNKEISSLKRIIRRLRQSKSNVKSRVKQLKNKNAEYEAKNKSLHNGDKRNKCPPIDKQCKEIIWNVFNFMKKESVNGQLIIPIKYFVGRTSEATGVSERTIHRITSEQQAANKNQPLSTKKKSDRQTDIEEVILE